MRPIGEAPSSESELKIARYYGTTIPIAISLIALLGVFAYVATGHGGVSDYSPGLRIKAPPYRWTSGCPQTFYLGNGELMGGCAREEYELRDAGDFGLSPAYRGNHWYRVGNHAIRLSCGFGGNCLMDGLAKNKFVQ